MQDRPSPPKFLTLLLLTYSGLLVYASLMPFNFVRGFDFEKLLLHDFWISWPFNPRGRISGSDLLSNLLLYLPLGGLLAARALAQGKNSSNAIFRALLICSTLSFCIELTQSTIKFRTPSATDWVLNTVSGLSGALAGCYYYRNHALKLTTWLQRRWREWPVDILSIILLLLLCADALAPFLPTIKLSQVWHSLKRSHFDLIGGFSQHPWHWWLMTKVLVFLALSLLLAFWNGAHQPLRRWLKTACLVTLFALALEFLKPMIVSRSINLANVVAGSFGAFLATVVGPLFSTRFQGRQILNLAILLLSGYLFYLAWTPFDFTLDLQLVQRRLSPPLVELLPLYHYAMGSRLEHVRLFVQNIALLAILVYLLRLRFAWFERSRRRVLLAMLIGLMVGTLQEGGQLLLVSRVPSMTDIYCFILAGVIGARIPKHEKS
jgi:VanZ family protein